jgi:hypothetical protein
MVIPLDVLSEVGTAAELVGCVTVWVVTWELPPPPLATTRAMAPPATAPPTIGITRLRRLI